MRGELSGEGESYTAECDQRCIVAAYSLGLRLL